MMFDIIGITCLTIMLCVPVGIVIGVIANRALADEDYYYEEDEELD